MPHPAWRELRTSDDARQKVIRAKVGLLELAKRLAIACPREGGGSQACKTMTVDVGTMFLTW
jgi:hypothetical protein